MEWAAAHLCCHLRALCRVPGSHHAPSHGSQRPACLFVAACHSIGGTPELCPPVEDGLCCSLPPWWVRDRCSRLQSPALGLASHGGHGPLSSSWSPSVFPMLTATWSLAEQSLCQILEASVNIGSRSLDVQLDSLLGTLHPQVRAGQGPAAPSRVLG